MTVSHLEVLVEEHSMERALDNLLPKVVPGISFAVRTFNGKPDLFKKLPDRLAGYRSWISHSTAVVVIVDRDSDDCHALVARLDAAARAAKFTPVSASRGGSGDILNRIAIEELEAWFFGDFSAIRTAYPHVSSRLEHNARFRDPDAITGGTAEALERVLQRAGYHHGGLRKPQTAHEIGKHLDVEINKSVSFQKFRDGVRLLVSGEVC